MIADLDRVAVGCPETYVDDRSIGRTCIGDRYAVPALPVDSCCYRQVTATQSQPQLMLNVSKNFAYRPVAALHQSYYFARSQEVKSDFCISVAPSFSLIE